MPKEFAILEAVQLTRTRPMGAIQARAYWGFDSLAGFEVFFLCNQRSWVRTLNLLRDRTQEVHLLRI
jgi:hypothetical protein